MVIEALSSSSKATDPWDTRAYETSCMLGCYVVLCTHDTQMEKIPMEPIQSIGIREFRANLHRYTVENTGPIAVTSHGRHVGYYIPARPSPKQEDFEALKAARLKLAAMLEESGVTEDEIVAEFEALRKQDPRP